MIKYNILEPNTGKPPLNMVVLLHGYGSNAQDLISLAPFLQKNLPNTVFVSPNAPFPCELMPDSGFQWFSLADYTPESLLAGAEQAAPLLDKFLDERLKEYGLVDSQLALLGFSQGAMMSLYVGPRRRAKIAGILGYSGALIGEGSLPAGSDNVPVHLIHGEADDVVTIDRYHDACKALNSNGYQLTGHSTPGLAHSIDEVGIESGAEFLAKVL